MSCNCSATSSDTVTVNVCKTGRCVSLANYQDFVLKVFESSDPCVGSNVDKESVDFYFQLAKYEFCQPELIFLRAYQTVVHSLMNCYAYQYDITERRGESHSNTKGNSRTDGNSQAQATGSAYALDKQGATARYADYSRARMDAEAERLGCSSAGTSGFAEMHDESTLNAHNRAKTESRMKKASESLAASSKVNESTDEGATRGYDFTQSYSGAKSKRFYAILYAEDERTDVNHSTRGMYNVRVGRGTTNNDSFSWSSLNGNMAKLDGARSDACQSYLADILSSSKDRSRSDSSNKYHAERHQRQRAEGDGFQRASQDTVERSSSQSSATANRNSDGTKSNDSWKFSTISSYKRSQKYDTLRMLYDQLTDQISTILQFNAGGCMPYSGIAVMQPFLDVANCENRDWTINSIISRFPVVCCFGFNPSADYASTGWGPF